MRSYFIFNNLKVGLHVADAPIPGFSVLGYEPQCSTVGTLWDIGTDAGFSVIGKTEVKGQLWLAEDVEAIKVLEEFVGLKSGLTEPTKIKVRLKVEDVPPIFETLDATVYRLTSLKNYYKIVNDGWWALKRWSPNRKEQLC